MRDTLLILILFVFNFASAQKTNSDCTDNFVLSNTESNKIYTYNAQNSITTQDNYSISASSDIKMKAGNVIVLKPGTYLKKGPLYLAKIEACTICEQTFSFPNFFTPNGDGFNDSWKVDWFDSTSFSAVSIFDRYGKLIKVLQNVNDTWDGTSNSNDISSSDYWFRLKYVDCNGNSKEYKSHFSLKR